MMFVSFEESFLLLELFRSLFLWFFYILLDPFPTDWAYIFEWNFMYDFFYWSLPEIRQCILNICWSEKYENKLVLCIRKPLFLWIFFSNDRLNINNVELSIWSFSYERRSRRKKPKKQKIQGTKELKQKRPEPNEQPTSLISKFFCWKMYLINFPLKCFWFDFISILTNHYKKKC